MLDMYLVYVVGRSIEQPFSVYGSDEMACEEWHDD